MQDNVVSTNKSHENDIVGDTKLCPNCGNALKMNDTFCTNCGQKLPLEGFFSLQFIKDYFNIFIVTFISVIIWGLFPDILIEVITIIFVYIYFMNSKISIPKSLFKKIIIYEFCVIILSLYISGLLDSFFSKTQFYLFSVIFIYLIYGFIYTLIFSFLFEMRIDYAK